MVFPDGDDGDSDTFTLAERRDALEGFIQEVVSSIDFLLYHQLYTFLGASTGMGPLVHAFTRCQAVHRGKQLRRRFVRVSCCIYVSIHLHIIAAG